MVGLPASGILGLHGLASGAAAPSMVTPSWGQEGPRVQDRCTWRPHEVPSCPLASELHIPATLGTRPGPAWLQGVACCLQGRRPTPVPSGFMTSHPRIWARLLTCPSLWLQSSGGHAGTPGSLLPPPLTAAPAIQKPQKPLSASRLSLQEGCGQVCAFPPGAQQWGENQEARSGQGWARGRRPLPAPSAGSPVMPQRAGCG